MSQIQMTSAVWATDTIKPNGRRNTPHLAVHLTKTNASQTKIDSSSNFVVVCSSSTSRQQQPQDSINLNSATRQPQVSIMSASVSLSQPQVSLSQPQDSLDLHPLVHPFTRHIHIIMNVPRVVHFKERFFTS